MQLLNLNKFFILLSVCFCLCSSGLACCEVVNLPINMPIGGSYIYTPSKVQHWKSLRDAQIVKQDLDFSCGAASLATILNAFYKQQLTEQALLIAMDAGTGAASFDDMVRALPQFGFRATGYAASFTQLAQLKRPVILYLKYRKQDHFTVMRGINQDYVWLADPSLGNRRYTKAQFLEMWDTRSDAQLKGKFLAVLPLHISTDVYNFGFFETKFGLSTDTALMQIQKTSGDSFH